MRIEYDQTFKLHEITDVENYLKDARIDEFKCDENNLAVFKQYCELLGKDKLKSPRDFRTLKIHRVARKNGVKLDRKTIQKGLNGFCRTNLFVRSGKRLRRSEEIKAGLRPNIIEKDFY